MQLEKGKLYHIFNQGNNKQKVFFEPDNYTFFLQKLRIHVLPFADILAWCLMPNHFHLMVYVKDLEVEFLFENDEKKRKTFNKELGVMLRSYTNAFNKRYNKSGSLFRSRTKAECVNCNDKVALSFFKNSGVTLINISNPELEYPQVCFNYIHQNPTKAGLVRKDEDWDYSSAKDYVGLRKGTLVNKERAAEYVTF